MSKPAFTPGPYEVSPLYLKHGFCDNDGSIAICATDEDGDGFPICRVNTRQKVKRGTGHTLVCSERDATAHLLSAAPDMLGVLEELADPDNDVDLPEWMWRKIDAARAKARGEK